MYINNFENKYLIRNCKGDFIRIYQSKYVGRRCSPKASSSKHIIVSMLYIYIFICSVHASLCYIFICCVHVGLKQETSNCARVIFPIFKKTLWNIFFHICEKYSHGQTKIKYTKKTIKAVK